MDWEQTITDKIDRNRNAKGFPAAEDFGTTDDDVKDYIYDKQRILDREEERKKSLTIPGIILVMPVIIISGFGEGVNLLLLGVLLGVILMLLYFVLMKSLDKNKLKKIYDSDIEDYIAAVTKYKEK